MIYVNPDHVKPRSERGYNERQYKIITGEIPYEETSGHDYRWIKEKAIELGDYSIAERMDILQKEKKKDYIPINRENSSRRYYESHPDANDTRNIFTFWELDILEGRRDYAKYSAKQLKHLYDKAVRIGNEDYTNIANMLYILRSTPMSAMIIQDPYEARQILDDLTFFPISWPERWYKT